MLVFFEFAEKHSHLWNFPRSFYLNIYWNDWNKCIQQVAFFLSLCVVSMFFSPFNEKLRQSIPIFREI